MKTGAEFSLLDVFDLTDLESEVYLCLVRYGRMSPAALDRHLDATQQETEKAIARLVEKKQVATLADGQVEAVIGRIKGRTTLPVQLWDFLLPANRLFSVIDIAALRSAVPILKFARGRQGEFADHGHNHALRVKSFARQLGYVLHLSDLEQELLGTAALFHDVGNVVDRERHHIISQETVIKLTNAGELPFTQEEAAIVGLICRWHRREYDPTRCDDLDGVTIRTGLLASVLRVADAMDIDHRRSDYSERFSRVLEFFFPGQLPYWTSLEEIYGVRICCRPDLQFQVLTKERIQENMQISMLRDDLASTPLGWSIQEIPVHDAGLQQLDRLASGDGTAPRRALLVFPFEPNSLIMAAISRKHLQKTDCDVQLLCYPDTPGGSAWLWNEVLDAGSWTKFDHLVVIGDRPDPKVADRLLQRVGEWLRAETAVSLLNRHEANWSRIPALINLGVDVVLGGDWAYFWGDNIDYSDLAWGRIAALATRDPTQSTNPPTIAERAITHGLMKLVYDAAADPAQDTDGWIALADPILDRIQNDDHDYFIAQAGSFSETYGIFSNPGKISGKTIHFEEPAAANRRAYPWALEAAIEKQGRTLARGICFNVPYAIVTWPDGDTVALLAINHWLEEEAIPIRLQYPADLGLIPVGNERIIQVRLPADQAQSVVKALIHACNQEDPQP